MVRTKVFVGNLSFATKENELAKEFEVAGKVISANIITRGPRSLGYGFVEMDNETDAENAVKMLDKKEIDGRPINVEVAKPREEGADAAQQANAQAKPRSNRGPRGPRGPRPDSTGAQGQGQGSQSGQQQQRPPRTQGPRDGQSKTPNSAQGQGQGSNLPGRRKSDSEGSNRAPRPPRAARPPRVEDENRTPSTTTLFVANLPFSMEDDAFSKVLKDSSLTYKTAHVVKKKTGRSKGFGFIEFDSEGDQQKALAALNNKQVDGRELAVKVALTPLRTQEATGTASPKPASSPAPSKAAASPATTQKTTDQ